MIALAVVIVLAFSRAGRLAALDNPIMAKLGALSFAVYLVHYPILCVFLQHGYLPGPELIASGAVGPAIYALPLTAFFVTVLSVAFLARTFVEVPCNALLTKSFRDSPCRTMHTV